jgi:hypothetical protein
LPFGDVRLGSLLRWSGCGGGVDALRVCLAVREEMMVVRSEEAVETEIWVVKVHENEVFDVEPPL